MARKTYGMSRRRSGARCAAIGACALAALLIPTRNWAVIPAEEEELRPAHNPAAAVTTPPRVARPTTTASLVWDARTTAGLPLAADARSTRTAAAAHLDAIEKKWGIRVQGIRRSAGGYMLDFRYILTDKSKAAPLFDRAVKPHLIDQASGAKMLVPNPPKVGPMRTANKMLEGRGYFIIFGNPGQFIKPGNKVTIVIGEVRLTDLVVE